MAKIKFGLVVTDARNKLGGHVFSKNRSGAYLRTLVTPVNPQTSSQTSVRALFGSISQGWSSLTEAQREAWRTAVDAWQRTDIFGDLKRPTGKALYQRLNQQAQVVGYPAISVPSQPAEIASGVIADADIDITTGEIGFNGGSTSADSKVQLFATPPLSQGTKFVKDKLRQVYFSLGSAYVEADAYTAYVAKFGAPADGSNVYLGIKYVDEDGNSTPLQTVKAAVSV